jgi:predicted Zn-dependent peptidase
MRRPTVPAPRVRPAGPVVGALLAAAVMAAAPAAAQERFRRTPPLPDAQRLELKLPAVETFSLANGLTVATVRRPETGLVTIQLLIKAGEADSPPERPGLATVTARMIGKGTRMLSADYLENMVESLGARFQADVFMDYSVLTLTVLEAYADRAIYILRLMTLEANFGERELAAVRRGAFWQILESKKDDEVLGWRRLLGTLFEGHPYRMAVYDEEAVSAISTRDVNSFYQRFYRPTNAAIIVSGNIEGPATAQKVGSHFAGWGGSAPERTGQRPPSQNERERVLFVESPGAVDATIFAGNVIMGVAATDVFPFLVLKQILGGTTQSRLFMNLRESRGYATYAFSEMEVYDSCGLYWVRARVRPESIVPAKKEIETEIGALAAGPAIPSEIEEAKSYLVGNMPLRFESRAGFTEWLARYVAFGFDPRQWDRGPEEVKLVNAEKVREAAKKYFAAKPVVVVVGRPEWLELYLGDLAAVEVYDAGGRFKNTWRKGEVR